MFSTPDGLFNAPQEEDVVSWNDVSVPLSDAELQRGVLGEGHAARAQRERDIHDAERLGYISLQYAEAVEHLASAANTLNSAYFSAESAQRRLDAVDGILSTIVTMTTTPPEKEPMCVEETPIAAFPFARAHVNSAIEELDTGRLGLFNYLNAALTSPSLRDIYDRLCSASDHLYDALEATPEPPPSPNVTEAVRRLELLAAGQFRAGSWTMAETLRIIIGLLNGDTEDAETEVF